MRRQFRRLFGPLGTSPWLRAPLLLFRVPALMLATLVAVGILGVASAASPLFLSSSSNGALQNAIGGFSCPSSVGYEVGINGPLVKRQGGVKRFQDRNAALTIAVAPVPHLGPPVLTVVGSTVGISRSGQPVGFQNARLITRDGFLQHISVVERAAGEGVWITDRRASSLGVHAGDAVDLHGVAVDSQGRPHDRTVSVPVAGVYRDLSAGPPTTFWCSQSVYIYPLNAFANFLPPPLLLMDRQTFLDLGERLGSTDDLFSWQFPLRPEGLTLDQVNSMGAALTGISTQLAQFEGEPFHGLFGFYVRTSTELPAISRQATGLVDAMRGSVGTVSLAGRAVALVVIAAVGIYWVDRRRREVGLLGAKGVSPRSLALKVLLEVLPITAVGAALGWLGAIWLVKRIGPTPFLEPGAESKALTQVILTTAIGLVFLAIVAALAARRQTERGPSRGREVLARTPWEIPVLVLAAASLYEILTRGAAPVRSAQEGPARIDVLLLLFPILFVAGLAGLASRALRRLLPLLRAAGTRWRPSLYLGSRRLAGASGLVLLLITASALAIGILAYSGTLTSSASATSHAKAALFTGSDVSVSLPKDVPIPRGIANGTLVTAVDSLNVLPRGVLVKVLAVDRRTFARAAFWDPSFADRSLPDLLARIAPGNDAGRVRALAAGAGAVDSGSTLLIPGQNAHAIRLDVVGRLRAFPGQEANVPLLVMDRAVATRQGLTNMVQLWAKGDPGQILAAVHAAHLPALDEASVPTVQRTPEFLTLSWTFGLLEGLGVMTGVIALGGVLLYLEARQRQREVSYALARRMGLRRRSHRVSVMVELAGMLLVAFVLGSVLAGIAGRLVYAKLDPLPSLPPPALFRIPLGLLGLAGAVLLVASAVGAWRVQYAADRARVTEVMRVAN